VSKYVQKDLLSPRYLMSTAHPGWKGVVMRTSAYNEIQLRVLNSATRKSNLETHVQQVRLEVRVGTFFAAGNLGIKV
jgi:hypothetical protein